MDEAELEQFYEREYRIERQETEDPIEKDLQMQDARARAILEMVQHPGMHIGDSVSLRD